MYNKTYYPTPKEVISQMITPLKEELKTANILEPSAGMGAICDSLVWSGAVKQRLYCCEIDPEMQATLAGKGYKIVNQDFLTYSGSMNFDLIIMNPPFDRGADHLLKAWEIMRSGKIVCLLNEETIKNPHTETRRQLSDIIARHGTVEFIGDAFAGAARKTGVGVALVRLEKNTARSAVDFDLKASEQIEEIELGAAGGDVERSDYISALIRAYGKAVETTENLYRAMADFRLYAGAFASEYDTPKLCAQFFETARKQGYVDAHNEYILALQKKAWDTIFNKTRVSGLMTTKVRDKFNTWREQMGGTDLNQENIAMLFEALMQQRGVITDECIVEAFDKITYYSTKNRTAVGEKYKTNSAYMVADKFILNYIVETGWSGGLSTCHRSSEMLNDIDRALCMVSGKSFEDIKTTYNAIYAWCRDRDQPEESEFFTFKCYLKGSAHFKFKDNALRMEFNRRACAGKGWQLPEKETFGKGSRRR